MQNTFERSARVFPDHAIDTANGPEREKLFLSFSYNVNNLFLFMKPKCEHKNATFSSFAICSVGDKIILSKRRVRCALGDCEWEVRHDHVR